MVEFGLPIDVLPGGTAPRRMTPGSLGMDCYAREPREVTSTPRLVPLGFRVAIPPGYVGLITPRSSLARRHIFIPNSPGVIDQDYRDEVQVIMQCVGGGALMVKPGDRVCQLLVLPAPICAIVPWQENDLPDRGGGFGSTGQR